MSPEEINLKCGVCGQDADQIIKNKLPNATVSCFVCKHHAYQTFQAIKWKLVSDGTWIPGALVIEDLPVGTVLVVQDGEKP